LEKLSKLPVTFLEKEFLSAGEDNAKLTTEKDKLW